MVENVIQQNSDQQGTGAPAAPAPSKKFDTKLMAAGVVIMLIIAAVFLFAIRGHRAAVATTIPANNQSSNLAQNNQTATIETYAALANLISVQSVNDAGLLSQGNVTSSP